MYRTSLSVAAVVGTLAAMAACSRCSGGDETSPDASTDRAGDTRADRSLADAPYSGEADTPDAPVGDWPGWKRIPDLQGLNCPLDVAIDPGSVVPAINWIPCKDGRPNCEEIDGTPFSPEIIKFANGWFSRDGRAFVLIHYLTSNTVAQFDVFDTKTLAPLAAWRADYTNAPVVYCDVNPRFTPTRMGVLYDTAVNGADGGPISRAIQVGTPAALMANPSLTVLPVTGDGTAWFESSDSTFAFDMALSTSIVRGIVGTAAVAQPKWPHQLVGPVVVVGDDVYAANQHGTGDGWYREAQIGADASVGILREAPKRHVTAMVTDGVDWYWVESFGVDNPDEAIAQPSVEIYTAPYTSNSATLDSTKKRIATLPPGLPFEGVASPGHYIVQAISGQNEVFRASDGHRTTVANKGVGWCWTPLFASDSEFWCIESNGQNGANGVRVTKTHLGSW